MNRERLLNQLMKRITVGSLLNMFSFETVSVLNFEVSFSKNIRIFLLWYELVQGNSSPTSVLIATLTKFFIVVPNITFLYDELEVQETDIGAA